MNFANFDLENIFDNADYTIEPVKTHDVFEPLRWKETFGKPLHKFLYEAKILHHISGVTLALKRYARAKHIQVVEFAGIYGYTEESEFKRSVLIELLPRLQECYVRRVDVCLDYKKVPNRILKKLAMSGREQFKYYNTTYYKTASENKTNPTLDIKHYNKQIQANLPVAMERLEFCFKGRYFQNMKLKELDRRFLSKMEKTISKFSGVNSKIIPIS
ncbi:hypothetical protein N9W00_02050 [Arcobacteraceae bacterium]|nr:hypothetical protein [Arcobacteraceae bacterium]